MAPNDSKPPEIEQRASTHISRTLSIHADGSGTGTAAVDDDDDFNIMALTVADGFRPSEHSNGVSAFGPGSAYSQPSSGDSRPSFSSIETPSDQNRSSIAAETASIPFGSNSDSAPIPASDSAPASAPVADPTSDAVEPSDPSIEPSSVSEPLQPTMPSGSDSTKAQATQFTPSVLPGMAHRPSSISKPPIGSSLLGSGSEGGPSNARDASAQASSSIPVVVPGDEPYQGPSGPSFPYQLYPQNVRMERTMSGMTTSTAAPSEESSYNGPRGPTFPYSLYPQSTMVGSGAVPTSAIPVGFPGMTDAYQRRLGPEGEEIADMIGPDDATPTAGPEQAVAAPAINTSATATTAAAATAATGANLRPIPGAGGIGLAPRNPEFDSAEDLDSPESRHSSRSFTSDASQNEINAGGQVFNEKRLPPRVRVWARRRLFGIVPYWAICLAIIAIVIVCIILGAVIGTLLSKHKGPPPLPSLAATTGAVTVTVDATPIATPANLIALPTGSYSLPMSLNKSPNSCFNDTSQSAAWSCNVWYMAGMTVDISSGKNGAGNVTYGMSLDCNISETLTSDIFWYGEQPPTIPTATALQLVNDTTDLTRGPAWFTMLPYNKTVIVRESMLTAATPVVTGNVQGATVSKKQKMRREQLEHLVGRALGPPPAHGHDVAQAGDKPWVCTWPDTLLEVFIYPNQNTSWNNVESASAPQSSWPTSTVSPSRTGMTSFSSSVATQTGVAATATMTPMASDWPIPFPRVVKLEERRMAGTPEATCVQYQLKPAGTGVTAVPNLDGNGKQIQVTIAEEETENEYSRRSVPEGALLERRDSAELSDCGCLWIVS
ncbi:hypothetical protein CMQ_3462 [Grosmannia clavigera kw1407]|uniref:DUF7820 domain-containing protein n=1 Tax=Grosmannia clavigera (strain kw1407 / UAMH 11150) TaxID=655863 RepID=F0X9H5_GROCL|nr:uncharacterized protein CMQ_3462 [Grosmannia clavigera kw1407]EFX05393.1 hypothetical protein CMQ_3462 [Grosmannia clavigera kw1407]